VSEFEFEFEFEGVSVFEFVFEFEGVSVFEFEFEGGWGERARSGAGWRFSSAMPKSSKTGQHGAQSVEQQEHVLHVRLRSQSQQLDCF